MRHWHKPFPTANYEEMSADGGRRLYVKVQGRTVDHTTDTGGILKRENGWIYGGQGDRRFAVPESAVVGIVEA